MKRKYIPVEESFKNRNTRVQLASGTSLRS
jgi:hypothetical protein